MRIEPDTKSTLYLLAYVAGLSLLLLSVVPLVLRSLAG